MNTLQFYGKSYDDLRQEVDKSLQQLWSHLNVLSKRVGEIGKSIELIQRYSYEYSVKIVGLPEIKASESASDTTTLCLSLFQALKFLFKISILLILLSPETPLLARDQSFASSQEGLVKRRSRMYGKMHARLQLLQLVYLPIPH